MLPAREGEMALLRPQIPLQRLVLGSWVWNPVTDSVWRRPGSREWESVAEGTSPSMTNSVSLTPSWPSARWEACFRCPRSRVFISHDNSSFTHGTTRCYSAGLTSRQGSVCRTRLHWPTLPFGHDLDFPVFPKVGCCLQSSHGSPFRPPSSQCRGFMRTGGH